MGTYVQAAMASKSNCACGDVFSDEFENELVEADDISQFGFLEAP